MFRNRGEMPNVVIEHVKNGDGGHAINIRPIFIVQYDKNFVLMQIAVLMIFIIVACNYL